MAVAPVSMHVPARERPEWVSNLGAQALALAVAIAVALAVGSVIIVLYGESPMTVYRAIWEFSTKSPSDLGRVLSIATPLIFSALAVSVCFKGGMFNIGVEGQFLVSMVSASVAALYFGFLPAPLHLLSVLVFAMLGGMIWAFIPGILKVKTGAHEVVTTIMLNGIAVSLVAWSLNGPLRFTETSGFNVDLRTDYFPRSTLMPDFGHLFGMDPFAHLTWLFPLALVAAVAVWFLFKRTRLGYEARAVGSSPGSARAGGISIGSVQLKLFLISGALAGLVGMQQLIGEKGALGASYEAELGFTGIAVAFLGQNNPFGIVAAAIAWAILSRGEDAVQIETSVPRETVIILQGVLILAVVVAYQVVRRRIARRQLRAAATAEDFEDSESPEDIEGLAKEGR